MRRQLRHLLLTLLCLFVLGTHATIAQVDPPPPPEPAVTVGVAHQGSEGNDFTLGANGIVSIRLQNSGNAPTSSQITVQYVIPPGLRVNGIDATSDPAFTCDGGTAILTCTTVLTIAEGEALTLVLSVQAIAVANDSRNAVFVFGADIPTPINAIDPNTFDVLPPPTGTPTPTATVTPTPSWTPTFPGLPTFTPIPTVTPTHTPTFIPPPATRTPLPRPANAGQAVPIPPTGITFVVNRDGVNLRLLPAIGAEVIGNVNAGFTAEVEARSGDNEWVRFDLAGQQAWIGVPVITFLSGDLNAAPVADPRTIPFGGWENPRAGLTGATSAYSGRLADSGLRIRSGPGRAYVVLANAPRYTVFPLLGRTATNNWVQVNFEGTLGWVATEYVELQQGLGVLDALPVNGIVADALPVSGSGAEIYADTLKLLQSRLELAQPSLDAIRAIWTNIAIGGRVECGSFPARPSDYNIPNPVLAANFGTLDPLQRDFNNAMANLRSAIDLFIDVCSSPQPAEGFVGQPVVQQALDLVNLADSLFSDLRRRLGDLVPADHIPTEDECVFSFNNQTEIVPRLRVGQVNYGRLTARRYVTGFCFDASVGQSLRLEILRTSGDIVPRVSVSLFTNPTNFVGTAQTTGENGSATIAPIMIAETGQYIVIVSDLDAPGRSARVEGEFAILLSDVTGGSTTLAQHLGIDPATGNVILTTATAAPVTLMPGGMPGIVTTPGIMPGVTPGIPTVACPGFQFTCQQLTVEQAYACLYAGNRNLDMDGDGIPCE